MIYLENYLKNNILSPINSGVNYPKIKDYNTMYINFNKTYDILRDSNSCLDIEQKLVLETEKIHSSKDSSSIINKFKNKPQGFIIQDTFNNPFFPITPKPIMDTARMDLSEVFIRYREQYTRFNTDLLPWHFVVEYIKDRYFVFNTRPVDMKFPISTVEAKKRKKETAWDEVTDLFFDENIFDINDAIHICIVGSTKDDIYTKSIYSLIGKMCLSPYYDYFKIPRGLFQRTFGLNLGGRFNLDSLTRYTHK